MAGTPTSRILETIEIVSRLLPEIKRMQADLETLSHTADLLGRRIAAIEARLQAVEADAPRGPS